MPDATITIDMEKTCQGCGEPGAMPNGLCMACAADKLVTLQMHIDKADLKLAKAALDNEDGNPVLNCLLVRDDTIVAADGFAVVVREKSGEAGSINRGEVMIPLNIVGLLKLGKDEHVEIVETDEEDKTANIMRGMLTMASVTFKPREGTYPDYRQLFPAAPNRTWVSMDIELLRNTLKALPGEGAIDIGIVDPKTPVELRMGDEDGDRTYALMMPMLRPEEYRPRWFKGREQ